MSTSLLSSLLKTTILAATAMLLAMPALGDEPHIERKLKIVVDGEVETFGIDDLEIGESQEVVTDSGKVIFVTRTETGYQFVIDGEEINVEVPHIGGDGDHRRVMIKKRVHADGHGDDSHDDGSTRHKTVIIKRAHPGDLHEDIDIDGDLEGAIEEVLIQHLGDESIQGHRMLLINGEGDIHGIDVDDDNITWIDEGIGAKVLHLGTSPSEHLVESGVLDDLDEAKRQEILDALADLEARRGAKLHKIVEEIKVEKDDE